MRQFVATIGAVLACVTGSASAGSDADAIAQALRAAPSVSFYFVSRTERYDYDNLEMQSKAGVAVKRTCGANCHNFMGPVLARLRTSKKSSCLPGQQDLLITFGGTQLVYSYSGRQAMYEGRCYFNPQGIHDLLKKDGYFFR